MTETELRNQILELLHRIAPERDLTQIDPEQNLRESLEMDSFDFLTLLVAIQKRLGISVPESDYARVSTLNALVTYLQNVKVQ